MPDSIYMFARKRFRYRKAVVVRVTARGTIIALSNYCELFFVRITNAPISVAIPLSHLELDNPVCRGNSFHIVNPTYVNHP